MDIPAVARRYAQALYDQAVAEANETAVREDLAAIREMIRTMPEFAAFLDNPTIAPDAADRTTAALFSDRIHPATMRFIRFLTARGRLSQLRAVCDAYEQSICEQLGILKAKITAAHDLSDAQLAAMKQRLSDRYRKQVEASVEVDSALIGGFKIQVGDHIQDFSIASRLKQFEQRVLGA